MRNLNLTNTCIPFNNVLFFFFFRKLFAISHNKYISLIEKE